MCIALFVLLCMLAAGVAQAGQQGPTTSAVSTVTPDSGTGRETQSQQARLASGQRAKIEGRLRPDGSLVARRVRLRDPARSAKLQGVVTASDPAAGRLTVAAVDVSIATKPNVYRSDGTRAGPGELRVGDIVEIRGLWRNERVYATQISLGAPNDTISPNDVELESVIERWDEESQQLVVLGRTVVVRDTTKIEDERTDVAAPVASAEPQPVNRLKRDEDEQHISPIQIGRWVSFGGRIDSAFTEESNFDLDEAAADRYNRVSSGVQVQAVSNLRPTIEAYAKVGARRSFMLAAPADRNPTPIDYRVYEAYLSFNHVGSSAVAFRFGRQRFRDRRGWLFDEYLDAARLLLTSSGWKLDAAVARGLFSGPEETRRDRDKLHVILVGSRRIARGTISGFLIRRDDHSIENEDPWWLGVSASGRVTSRWRYWSDTAIRRGREDDTRLRAWAVDAGTTYRFRLPGSPSLTLAYAQGSGDRSTSDGVDGNFKQTDLESNSASLDGLKWFAYYGEVFDPELTNLRILTAAAAARPTKGVSIEAVYHQYRQDTLRRSLASNQLLSRGPGVSPDLGREVDIVIAVRRIRRVDLFFIGGVFVPGPGLPEESSPAVLWRPQVRIYF